MPDIEIEIPKDQQRHNLLSLRMLLDHVDPDKLHMHVVTETVDCGTAHCLLGWAMTDTRLVSQMNRVTGRDVTASYFDTQLFAAGKVFGLSVKDAELLFASGINAATDDPHTIGVEEVRDNLDRLIAGKPALPYFTIVEQQHDDVAGPLSDYEGPCAGGLHY